MPDPTAVAAALSDLGRRLDLPASVDPAAAAIDRIRAAGPVGRRHRPLLLAAAAVLVALALVAALPGPRAALARLVGIGGVEISPVERIEDGLSPALDLGAPLAVDDALVRLGDAVGADPRLGPPDAAFAGRPAGGVSLVWAPGPGLPAIEGTDAGLVLTAFPSSGPPVAEKLRAAGTEVHPVTVRDRPGYWITGDPHVLAYVGPDGEDESARLAGNTMLWSDGRTTYRLESALERDDALRHAVSLVG